MCFLSLVVVGSEVICQGLVGSFFGKTKATSLHFAFIKQFLQLSNFMYLCSFKRHFKNTCSIKHGSLNFSIYPVLHDINIRMMEMF
jgi:hypothetical protein